MRVLGNKCLNSKQIRAAGWPLEWGQKEALKCTHTSLSSLWRYQGLEPDQNPYHNPRPNIIDRIVDGLNNAGIELLNSEDSIGVTLRTRSKLNEYS